MVTVLDSKIDNIMTLTFTFMITELKILLATVANEMMFKNFVQFLVLRFPNRIPEHDTNLLTFS